MGSNHLSPTAVLNQPRLSPPVWIILAIVFASIPSPAEARSCRVGLIPNGTKASCGNCHVFSGGGGPRNNFGADVEALVAPGSCASFWGPALAAIDSDGDGFTNGEELQDPNGAWIPGQPAPGDRLLVTNPGDETSLPETPTPTETPSETPTETPTDTPTASPTASPTETPTETPTEAPTEIPTASPTETPTVTPTPSDTPTETPTFSPTETPSPSETPTASPTESPTETPTQTATATPVDTASPTPTETPSATPSPPPTETSTPTPSATPTASPSATPSATASPSPSTSPVPTASPTAVPLRQAIEDYLLGRASNPAGLDLNGDAAVDIADYYLAAAG